MMKQKQKRKMSFEESNKKGRKMSFEEAKKATFRQYAVALQRLASFDTTSIYNDKETNM